MTDAEIIKALECCADEYIHSCDYCPFEKECNGDNLNLVKFALDLINRQKAEIDELTEKLECLLCHATGSKLSKSTYSLRTMESAVNDEVQECCEEVRAEAIKEFAERLKEHSSRIQIGGKYDSQIVTINGIDYLVKEMVGESDV